MSEHRHQNQCVSEISSSRSIEALVEGMSQKSARDLLKKYRGEMTLSFEVALGLWRTCRRQEKQL
jgi:hypothetical protein